MLQALPWISTRRRERSSVYCITSCLLSDLAAAGRRRVQVPFKPLRSQPGDLLQGAGFLEQMTGPGHDHELLAGGAQVIQSLAVQLDDREIAAADQEEGRRFDVWQSVAGEVRPAAARDDRANHWRPLGRRY